MKSRKPKAKTKRNAKRNSKQSSPAAEQVQVVPTPGTSAEPVSTVEALVEAETLPNIVETRTETEASVVSVELRKETADSASGVELPSETDDLARTEKAQAEIENSAATMGIREETEDSPSSVELRDQPDQFEDLESLIELHIEVENSPSPAEVHDASSAATNPSSPTPTYDGAEIPVIPVDTPPVAQMPPPRSALRSAADRRAHPRYAFAAAIEVVAPELGARIKSQVRDLSQQGCYVDTDTPLALGTATDVRILKGSTTFEARARVVYNQTGKGMGLMFTTVELEQLKTLDTWITESRESSWRAANRRRSQRVMMKVPVRVSGQAADGANFEEETHTLSISPHGALLVLAPAVQRGQRFILANLQTKAALECVVAHLERIAGEPTQVGVEFSLPNPAFWRVAFPPKDWTPRHPDAKSR